MITGFGNNTVSALASDITATQTTFSVIPGAGEKFERLLTTDNVNAGSPHNVYAKLTLTDSQGTVFEICHLTKVAGDSLTVIRGQEGTTAKGWSLNDVVANFATRGSEESFVQIEHLQGGDFTSATAGGTPNGITISLPSTYLNNASSDWALKIPLMIMPIAANTGAVTIQVTLAGKVVGTFPAYKGNKGQLEKGDILTGVPFICAMDNTKTYFTVINPVNIYGALLRANNLSDAADPAKCCENIGALPTSGGTLTGALKGTSAEFTGSVTQRESIVNYRQLISRKDAFSAYTTYNRIDQVEGIPPAAVTSVCDITGRLTTQAGDPYGRVLGGLTIQHDTGGGGRIYMSARDAAGVITSIFALYGEKREATLNGKLTASGEIQSTRHSIKPGTWEGAGGFADQYTNAVAPFLIPYGYIAPKDVSSYAPIIKALIQTAGYGYGTAVSFGAVTSGTAKFAQAVIHVIGDNGISRQWFFDPTDGTFSSPGGNIVAGQGLYESGGAVRAYSSNYKPTPDAINAIARDVCSVAGFVSGNANDPYMRHSTSNAVVVLPTREQLQNEIAGTRNWANNDLRNDIYNWCRQSFVTGQRQASAQWSGPVGGGLQVPAGCVVIGCRNNGSSDVARMGLLYAAEQVCINGNWMTIGLV